MQVDIASVTGTTVIAIIIIAVVGNGMTLFVITRYDPLRDVTGMFLANLAAADLLQSIFGMPLIATSAFREEWLFGDTLCVISGMTNSLFCITSVLTLTAVSVDRYLAIAHPLNYHTWVTAKRAKLVLVYIWLQAAVAALLPVLGWSRYVYLPYEFICTVQWEYDPAYTIFVWLVCFVGPLVVTVVCYTGILKVATHHVREKPPIKVGTVMESEQVPDVGEAAGGDGKNPNHGREGLAFAAENKNKGKIVELSSSDISRISSVKDDILDGSLSLATGVVDHAPDTNIRGDVSGKSKVKMSPNPSGMIGMSWRNRVVVPSFPDTPTRKENVNTSRMDCVTSTLSGANEKSLIKSPALVVTRPPNPKTTTPAAPKTGASREHPPRKSVSFWGKDGKSRVSPAVDGSPVLNRWTAEANVRGEELMTISEGGENMDYQSSSSKLPGYLARVRERMIERRIGDKQSRRKEMKVALILLVVNGTFVLCWLPHFVGALCLTFTGGSCPFPDNFFIITTTLAMLNSGCNPFIYTLTYRKFRKAFNRVLPCFCSNHIGAPSE